MSTITKQQNPPASGAHRHHKKVLKFALIGGIILVIGLAGFLALQWWPKNSLNTSTFSKPNEETLAQINKDAASSRQALYDAADYGASPQDRAANLKTKMVTAEVGKDYAKLESFASQILALPGFENDKDALIELNIAYQNLNKPTERKAVLQKLKAMYEAAGQQDDYYYQQVVKDLGAL